MKHKTAEEYIPFGDEWKKEVNKLPKSFIIDQWKESCLKVQEMEAYRSQQVQVEGLPTKDEMEREILRDIFPKEGDSSDAFIPCCTGASWALKRMTPLILQKNNEIQEWRKAHAPYAQPQLESYRSSEIETLKSELTALRAEKEELRQAHGEVYKLFEDWQLEAKKLLVENESLRKENEQLKKSK